jgi:hypothetical protein
MAVGVDNVRLLASKCDGDELAQKLERAVTNENTIVALSVEDRERIIEVLGESPSNLADLRNLLVMQLKKLKDRERTLHQSRHNQELSEHRREGLSSSRAANARATPTAGSSTESTMSRRGP